MKIERKFTKAGQDAYADVEFVTTSSEIRNPDGTVVFKLDEGQLSVDLTVQSPTYFLFLRTMMPRMVR